MIVPGILFDREGALPDVIRGEETQVIGALRSLGSSEGNALVEANATGDVCFVLPGTHSKWVLVKDGRIVQFATYMTGELFATLRQHSILGRLMPAADSAGAQDEANQSAAAAAFLRAIELARGSGPGDLTRHLFTVRSMNLAGRLPATALADYLSGLLIGHELASATAWLGREAAGGFRLALIGEAALLRRYQVALKSFGLQATSLQNTAAAGMYHLLTLSDRNRRHGDGAGGFGRPI
jgi:2-dehydro-3-deoxygalactonokinase